MKTLHEMAKKLQEYIIRSQQDAHNSTNMNVTKYNNLKLKMDTKIHFPHVIICIGISEGTFKTFFFSFYDFFFSGINTCSSHINLNLVNSIGSSF